MARVADEQDDDDDKPGNRLGEHELPDESDMDDDPDGPDVDDCPYCGKLIHEDAEWCHHCGNYLSREDAPQRVPAWALFVAVVVIVVILVTFL